MPTRWTDHAPKPEGPTLSDLLPPLLSALRRRMVGALRAGRCALPWHWPWARLRARLSWQAAWFALALAAFAAALHLTRYATAPLAGQPALLRYDRWTGRVDLVPYSSVKYNPSNP